MKKKTSFLKVERNVFILGLVSFFQDVASEMIYPLFPFFLTIVLSANKAAVGLIEGVAESTASLLKVFSGALSDRLPQRKPLALGGYTLSSISKPFLSLVTSWPQALFLRFTDRAGKGIRTAPRDALIADLTSPEERGKTFGFHRAADTFGAVIGPLLAFLLFPLLNKNYRQLFLIAAFPAFISVFLLFFVKEKKRALLRKEDLKFSLKSLDKNFLIFLSVVTLFALGNSSDVFLLLRAENLGLSAAFIPLLYLSFNLSYTLVSYPAGNLSDKIGRKPLLVVGYLIFALVYLGLSFPLKSIYLWGFFLIYGIYRGLTDAVERAFVVDLVPAEKRGTALGAYHTFSGLALLPASLIGGALWDSISPSATFIYGALTASLAALLLALLLKPADLRG